MLINEQRASAVFMVMPFLPPNEKDKLLGRLHDVFERKELGAMYRKPARFACMAVGHGK